MLPLLWLVFVHIPRHCESPFPCCCQALILIEHTQLVSEHQHFDEHFKEGLLMLNEFPVKDAVQQ